MSDEKRTSERIDDVTARTYPILLSQLDGGDVVTELNQKLDEVVGRLSERAIEDGAATAELTVKLKFKCERGVVSVVPDVTSKVPKKRRPVIAYWMNRNNQLTLRDPRQEGLPFPREVTIDRPPPREAGDRSGKDGSGKH